MSFSGLARTVIGDVADAWKQMADENPSPIKVAKAGASPLGKYEVAGSAWLAFSKYKSQGKATKSWGSFNKEKMSENKGMALSLSSIMKPTLMFEENKIQKEQVYILRKVAFDRGDKDAKPKERVHRQRSQGRAEREWRWVGAHGAVGCGRKVIS
jgi:hypothetical protein